MTHIPVLQAASAAGLMEEYQRFAAGGAGADHLSQVLSALQQVCQLNGINTATIHLGPPSRLLKHVCRPVAVAYTPLAHRGLEDPHCVGVTLAACECALYIGHCFGTVVKTTGDGCDTSTQQRPCQGVRV